MASAKTSAILVVLRIVGTLSHSGKWRRNIFFNCNWANGKRHPPLVLKLKTGKPELLLLVARAPSRNDDDDDYDGTRITRTKEQSTVLVTQQSLS
jgi:hypothetical protein